MDPSFSIGQSSARSAEGGDLHALLMENARLADELRSRDAALAEAFAYQTATNDILHAISNSPTDPDVVLRGIAESAARLLDVPDAEIMRVEGEVLKLVAKHGPSQLWAVASERPIDRHWVTGRAVVDRTTVHVRDLQEEGGEFPVGAAYAKEYGHRTTVAAPLLRQGMPVGAILIRRMEVRPLTEKQIALLRVFADQVSIAFENTRLFEAEQARTRELSEALQQQTATSDILRVIARSPTDIQPVLGAVAESAARLCGAMDAHIFRIVGDQLRMVSSYGRLPVMDGFEEGILIDREWVTGRAVVDRKTVQVHDLAAESEAEFPRGRDFARRFGHRTTLATPLMREGTPLGAILIRRNVVRPFSAKQIKLLETFADQAVIAIENARLLEDVQVRTRELARSVQRLQVASEHKSQFVANMSHELRTPLAAILGYAELMQEGFYEPLGQKSLDALTRIRSNGKHLLGLINTVLDIAKIESGQFTLNPGEYAIEGVVETVRAATESLAETKKLALTTEIAERLPVGMGDEQRLTQVLLNLVGNAIKFTDAGEVRIAAMAADSHFTVSVTDTGPGIPTEHQARIFDQFHQVDNSNTKAKGGTGLGLAIAKQIVEMHGGRIWVESTLGKGATFRMQIPIRAECRKAAE
jgi:signal transduction histidine kinase